MGLFFSDPVAFGKAFLTALIEPVNSLWFLHMLAIFYVVTRATREVPIWIMLLFALGMNTVYQAGWVHFDWVVANRFMDRFIYFYVGYVGAQLVFNGADRIRSNSFLLIAGLLIWAVVNWYFATLELHHVPVIAPIFGLVGAFAVCALAVLLAKHKTGNLIRYIGENSLVVYLTFYLPMKVTEKLLDRVGDPLGSVGLSTAIILVVAVGSPLIFARIIKNTRLAFLYERPAGLQLRSAAVPT
jgi:uncharacterized membrane protein YcfT